MLGMALEREAPCDGALLSWASCLSLARPFPARSALRPPPRCGAREPPRPASVMGICLAYGLRGLKYLCEKQFQKRVTCLSVGGRVGPSWAAAWVRADAGVGSWQRLQWHHRCRPSFLYKKTQGEAEAGAVFIYEVSNEIFQHICQDRLSKG